MQASAIYDALNNQRPRSAWERGVVAYAESMLDELEPTEELWPRTVEKCCSTARRHGTTTAGAGAPSSTTRTSPAACAAHLSCAGAGTASGVLTPVRSGWTLRRGRASKPPSL